MSDSNSEHNELDLSAYEPLDEEGNWGLWEDDLGEEPPDGPTIPLDELLDKLVKKDTSMQIPADLYAFSDLSHQEVADVNEKWTLIDVEVRRNVIQSLVQLAEDDLRLSLDRFLRFALHDEDAKVRQAAVEGLWEAEDSQLVGSFLHLLRNDQNHDVRAAAANALGRFVLAGELEEIESSLAMRAEEALLAILRNEEEPIAVQSQALASIAYSGEAGVQQLIEDAYYSPMEEMRMAALNAMGRSADVRWRGLVRAELENPSAEIRTSAAIACGELEARASVEELIRLLDDEEQMVRLAAIYSLGRLGGKKAQEALRAVADSEYKIEAEAAEEGLEEMLFYGSQDSVALLDESSALDDSWESDESDDDPWRGWLGNDESDLGSYG